MRAAAGVVLALLLALVAAACSSGSVGSGATPSASASGTASASAGSFPAAVQHMYGTTVVKAQPQRVVALGWADGDAALSLGVVPVATLDWLGLGSGGTGPWGQAALAGHTAPTIIKAGDLDYEQIAALRPDLILDIKSDGSRTAYDTLSKIAPTIMAPKGTQSFGVSWTDQVDLVAQALGRPAEGQQVVADTKAALAQAAAAHPEFAGKTATVSLYYSEQYGTYVSRDGRMQFMEALGFVAKPAIESKDTGSFFVPVSKENSDLLDADVTVVLGSGTGSGVEQAVASDGVLQSTTAAEQGHLLVLGDADADVSNAFSMNSPLSIRYEIQQLVPRLAAAVAGTASSASPSASPTAS